MSKTLDEPLICDVMLPPATIIKRGCDLRTLLVAINQRGKLPPAQRVFRDAAVAQQPASTVPDGWKLVPAKPTPDMCKAAAEATGESDDYHEMLGRAYVGYNAMLAAAPAAPVAVGQEPVRELIGYACDRRGALIPDRCGDCLCWPAYEDATPAAEQPRPDGCPCNNASGPCENCDSAEQLHPLEQFTAACNRLHSACNKVRAKLDEMNSAKQPDTVPVPRELLERAMYAKDGRELVEANRELRALLAGGAE